MSVFFRNFKLSGPPPRPYSYTNDRQSDLLVVEIEALRNAVRATRARYSFHIDAWMVLPDHMHCLWTLPPDDFDFPARWQMIKALFSLSVRRTEERRASLVRKRESGIWQRRYWEHTIRDEPDYAAHMDYIHFNPVKHGLVAHAAEWLFSSFAKCVSLGMYPRDWAKQDAEMGDIGERR
jgi:putative transposase